MRPDDAEGIVALYAACMATEPNIGPITAGIWAGSMRHARFGYGRDFRVAFHGMDLVGLAESSLREAGTRLRRFVKIMVHPAHRRRGLGTRLLRDVVDQGPSHGPVLIESLPRSDWTAGIGFASRFGFEVTETEIAMRCPAFRAKVAHPAGIEIARTEPDAGAERAAAIHNAAYRSEASFVPNMEADMRQSLRDGQLWTARLDGRIVAFAIIEKDGDLTWLESLAVDPSHHARGIGGALATGALVGEGGEGCLAGLSVSSRNDAARKLYARLGFEKQSERSRYGVLRADLAARLAG